MLAARIKGRPRRFVLGPYPGLTVATARALAIEAKAAIARGDNPLDRRAERAEPTLGEFTAEYVERHARPNKKSWKDDVAVLRRYVPASWNARRLSDITRADVAALHADVGTHQGNMSLMGSCAC